MKRTNFLFALIYITLLGTCPLVAQKNTRTFNEVTVEGGLVSGTASTDGAVHIFKGIPFAAPPVGPLRWKAPQPVERWKGVKECVAFGPSPMQGKPVPFSVYTQEFLIPETPISEDCLYLNIWTAAKTPNEKRPVLVWIYGGGFASGGSAVPIYDGEAFSRKGVVLVSFNYRVGVFGFFVHPELNQETEYRGSGNYGLMDQIKALQWVKANINAFGGDPDNITIAGQSAGAISVNVLVASPLAKGLFHKAIGESGSSVLRKGFVRTGALKEKEQDGERILKALKASSIADLRKIPAEEIQANAKAWFTPVVDGYVIPKPIPDIFDEHTYSDVPLLTGWNNDETFAQVLTTDQFKARVQASFDSDADKILRFYPIDTEDRSARSQIELGRDETFAISNYAWALLQSKGNSKVYLYNFRRKPPATPEYVRYGAFHTAEVPYAFNTLKFFNRPLEQGDHTLAGIISSYWVNFASTGNPNGNGLPEWPAFTNEKRRVMILDLSPATDEVPNREALDFLFTKFR